MSSTIKRVERLGYRYTFDQCGQRHCDAGKSLLPERVWLRHDTENTYILLQAKGLNRFLQTAQPPAIFLSLFFDSDGNAQTGSHGNNIDGRELRGFDVKADLSSMQLRDKDGHVSSALNCQVSKWDGTQFSGNIAWGTQFNSKMSVLTTGEYAAFAIPRSILDISPKGMPARVAFDVPGAQYNTGRSLIESIRVAEK